MAKTSRFLSSSITCRTTSTNLEKCLRLQKIYIWSEPHTTEMHGHNHKAWIASSRSCLQCSHTSSIKTFRRTKLVLVGMEFLQARQSNFFFYLIRNCKTTNFLPYSMVLRWAPWGQTNHRNFMWKKINYSQTSQQNKYQTEHKAKPIYLEVTSWSIVPLVGRKVRSVLELALIRVLTKWKISHHWGLGLGCMVRRRQPIGAHLFHTWYVLIVPSGTYRIDYRHSWHLTTNSIVNMDEMIIFKTLRNIIVKNPNFRTLRIKK